MELVLSAIIIGVIATAALDVWAEILSKGFKLPTTNWGMVGRWFGHLPGGRLIHKPISNSKKIKYERAIGWVLHYAIGIAYAYIYLVMVHGSPGVVSALAFGLATVLVPWFILQPGLGLGCFARLAPKPNVTRLISLSMHIVFGFGLYLGWAVHTL
ncbi:MAG: DUF2938 domain-containing protein [Gammaproteobacteria bacterium]|nr:DUF2938 domain-containing protein [Gammaproteobacteria bacterium]MDH5800448.1 DUF2938 domain-containing protein [Gammaproteobacteria bacterium]